MVYNGHKPTALGSSIANYVSHVLAARGFLNVAPNGTADLRWLNLLAHTSCILARLVDSGFPFVNEI